jgi:hypothetical protein
VLGVAVGGVAVAHHNGLEVQHHGVARGGFAAHVGHGARDEHVVKALSPETFRQIRRALDEGAEAVFEHDFVLGQNL